MAWAVAFGLLLGVIPHGNLLALIVLLVVLSLKINHAMAGLTAVGATFLAAFLDPYSHEVGERVLTHPEFRNTLASAWRLPLVPWTDLNNTVVMGSFLIGLAGLAPVFAMTYPIFRRWAPKDGGATSRTGSSKATVSVDSRGATVSGMSAKAHQLVLVDQGHATVAPPHRSDPSYSEKSNEVSEEVKFVEIDHSKKPTEKRVAVETRIDVIRMKDHRNVGTSSDSTTNEATNAQPMDEALNYLLRQLRDSQQRKAA
jgi:uncharacterized protein (TIGR03546 family)